MAAISHARISLLDLPVEILRLILLIIYQDGNESVRSLKPLSLTCTAFREVVKPLLFHTKTAEFSDEYETGESCWVFRGRLGPLPGMTSGLIEHIIALRMLVSSRLAKTACQTGRNAEDLVNLVKRLDSLRTISFTPPIDRSAAVLNVLRHRNMHIIVDLRPGVVSLWMIKQWARYFQHENWLWSFALGDTTYSDTLVAIMPRDRIKAVVLEWVDRQHNSRPNRLETLLNQQNSTILEEVHLSRKGHELNHWHDDPSPALQIALYVSSLTNLHRLRVEGASFTSEILKMMPRLTKLEDLSIYSSYRAAFHSGCLEDNATLEQAEAMPWLQLPKLRKLDLRFICEHFTIQQLIPHNLLALRIEFYGTNDRFTLEDLKWLAAHSANLERLEVDIGNLNDSGTLQNGETNSRLACLAGFRKLRVLRLFPTYWNEGKLQPHPLPHPSWPVTLFTRLQPLCPSLRTLIISISYGEYPFDIIERMSVHTRPIKFVVKNFGDPEELVARCGHAGITEMMQTTYRAGCAEGSPEVVSVPGTSYFDDLGEDWILSHADSTGYGSWSYQDHPDVASSLADDQSSGAQRDTIEAQGR